MKNVRYYSRKYNTFAAGFNIIFLLTLTLAVIGFLAIGICAEVVLLAFFLVLFCCSPIGFYAIAHKQKLGDSRNNGVAFAYSLLFLFSSIALIMYIFIPE